MIDTTLALLERTPATLDAWLRALPDSWTRGNEGGASWTAHDILGHLIHGEKADWIPRVRHILAHGDTQPFAPFDREAQAKEAPRTLAALLDEFARLRAESLAALRECRLTPTDLERRGLHPALGAVTLGQLLATWAAHDMSHVHQLSRTMAHQYRDAVGPWRAYLGVLHCQGHGS